ncbi:hypothetical protein [Streptomyces sp. NPDC088146]|uniref:hypothetical protein n=1 Tax=Streptomyces sp. NPDC088146 TaxID=3365829 RepID=UPI00382DCE1A
MTAAAPAGNTRRMPELDAVLSELAEGELRWAATSSAERAALLARVHAAVSAEAENWVRTASRIKLLPDGSPLAVGSGSPAPTRC